VIAPQAPGLAPAQNRVTPLGDVVAVRATGAWMGNRGCLHDAAGTRQVRRHHVGRAWIACVLDFRDRRVQQWQPGRYTPLFFLDEAVALAAGHRPCGECRRDDYVAFRDRVATTAGVARLGAPDLDRILHEERWDARHRVRRLHVADWADLPDGVFVLHEGAPARVAGDRLLPWLATYAYGPPLPRPTSGAAAVITPVSTVDAIRQGYRPQVSAPPATQRGSTGPEATCGGGGL
jgi:hypothetical protein